MTSTEWIGYAGACGTTLAFVPQVIRVWRTRSTHDISRATFALMSAGLLLWLIYGVRIGDRPIMIANSITLVLSLIILVFKLRQRD